MLPSPHSVQPVPSPEETEQLQALIKSYCGLRVDAHKLGFSLQRAWPTLSAMGVASVRDLVRELGFMGGRTWVALVPFLTINETYFMRESKQLEEFMELALPDLRSRTTDALQILSAACSTGEEPYTLAMLLMDARVQARVWGGDIDQEAIARAEAAMYGRNSFRGLSPAWQEAHFEPVDAQNWFVRSPYREAVRFQRMNLLQAGQALAGRRFDAIFCRNVLIYFDRATQLSVIAQLRQLLVPGGYLCLGHSEMFFDVDLGMTVHATRRATMYQRRGNS